MAEANPITFTLPSNDLTGRSFGNWRVVVFAGRQDTIAFWVCRCQCGALALVPSHSLLRDMTKGCIKCYARRRRSGKTYKYREEYNIYCGMKSRCYNPARKSYADYGGRGIKVCERWLSPDGFDNFLADMGLRPSPKHQIDRIDNDGDYEPKNCRWATKSEQAHNRRTTRRITHDGKTLSLAKWAQIAGIPRTTLKSRLTLGWSFAEAISLPPNWKPRTIR